jgi:hypothetical protein
MKKMGMELPNSLYTAHTETQEGDHDFVKPTSYVMLSVLLTVLGYQPAGRPDGLRILLSVVASSDPAQLNLSPNAVLR